MLWAVLARDRVSWLGGSVLTTLGTVVLAACAWTIVGCGSSAKPTSARRTASADAPPALVPIGAGLRGPAGLEASLYAQAPPSVSSFAFDSTGHLWLTAAGLESHTYDGVYVVSRPGERAQRAIAGLEDPLGIDWYRGRLYVASVGRVDAYWGFDGRRFAGHRRILRGPAAGAENNLLVSAPHGRLVMGVSAACDHCAPRSRWDGAVVSFAPNGTDLRVYAARIRAPIGLTYYPSTTDLFVTMNQPDDLGASTPGDWLSVVREGQDWGFPGCQGQGGPLCAGVPDPLAELDRHAAVGGVAIATGQLGLGVGTAALVAEWNVAKIQRVGLRRTASGFHAEGVAPFLRGISHPMALLFGPGGALFVGDWTTGAVYRVLQRPVSRTDASVPRPPRERPARGRR